MTQMSHQERLDQNLKALLHLLLGAFRAEHVRGADGWSHAVTWAELQRREGDFLQEAEKQGVAVDK